MTESRAHGLRRTVRASLAKAGAADRFCCNATSEPDARPVPSVHACASRSRLESVTELPRPTTGLLGVRREALMSVTAWMYFSPAMATGRSCSHSDRETRRCLAHKLLTNSATRRGAR